MPGELAEIERLTEQCAALQAECDSFYAATAECEREIIALREQRDRLLRLAAAALERVQVEDPEVRYSEAEHLLSQVVTLDGAYVEPQP